jgi:hypothetical protein
MSTPRLGAPELTAGQAVPETKVNEALYWLDAASLGGFKVLDRDLTAPPGSPAQGDCYLIAAGATGAWSGHDDELALYINSAWAYRSPQEGWEAWVVDEAVKIAYSSGAWGIIGTFDGASYVSIAGDIMTGGLSVPTEVYGVSWNGSNEVPTKDALYDKFEALAGTIGGGDMLAAANLSDLDDIPTARTNLDVYSKAEVDSAIAASTPGAQTECFPIACSDETTALTTGTAKVTFRMPYAFTLTAVRASVTTAPTGAALQVDINEGGVSILSTPITIDASEKTSTTAAVPPVISDSALADDAEVTIDIDVVGSTVAGAGLKVYLIGHQ